SGHRAQHGDTGLVSGRLRALDRGVGQANAAGDVGHLERRRELCFRVNVEAIRTSESEAALEQTGRGAEVATPHGASPGEREPIACGEGEISIVLAELGEIEGRLLEVVAEDLLQLDQVLSVLLEPVGKTAMEVRSGRLRQSVI